VVSGVGHEIDTTICDLAADVRASTPSNAAEIVFPDRRELTGRVNLCRSGLIRACMGEMQQADLDLRNAIRRLSALSPEKRITLLMNRKELLRLQLCGTIGAKLDEAGTALNNAKTILELSAVNRLKEAEHATGRLRERLTAVSPMVVLNRGYALVYDGHGRLLTRTAEAEKSDDMTLQFADGRIAVTRKDAP
jgi:exodeoxyribonuclease VII large subunit